MNKYQRFVLEQVKCCVSKDEEPSFDKMFVEFVNSKEEFEVRQDENYNIKKHFIHIRGAQIASVKVDGKSAALTNEEKKQYRIAVNFEKPAKEIEIEFADHICENLKLRLAFIEVDHQIYDSKVQAEINERIHPEHKTGIDLVNIYWDSVSYKVAYSQINLYVVATGERLIGKFKESETTFKSITGLAFGTYHYEIIEFDNDGKELARTNKISFNLTAPNYSGRHTVII